MVTKKQLTVLRVLVKYYSELTFLGKFNDMILSFTVYISMVFSTQSIGLYNTEYWFIQHRALV